MSAKRLKGEQWIKEIIDSGSDSDEENEYNLAFRKRRKVNPARILRTSESEETEELKYELIFLLASNGLLRSIVQKFMILRQHSGVVGNNLNHSSRILDFFRLLFSEDSVKFIVEETNNYWCRQLKRDHLEVSKGTELYELYCFIAASLLRNAAKHVFTSYLAVLCNHSCGKFPRTTNV
ncbi:hypothetical protein AVEN_102629-1 [Araneus ventricosus]|uniref:PiggyBac transposable element-derived protein domain-containing protein n=1 Tax=Araneus ventricosus TaxID=182803 RepID=A0A4Y2BK10_ARAVE|nr:hypothetical protein AVEN_102629-1 [Araneus ventricosus]